MITAGAKLLTLPVDGTAHDVSRSLQQLVKQHPCSSHKMFWFLPQSILSLTQVAALLRNYDAHATILRRLLLQAATRMPEPAVGFVLENVRNEYGNGNYARNHQAQLKDVVYLAGVSEELFQKQPVMPGVQSFMDKVGAFYFPEARQIPSGLEAAATAAGAITATEMLAIEEFRCLQKVFAEFNLDKHIWFDHVLIEQEHWQESLALVMHFLRAPEAVASVEYGLQGVLDANVDLYDGLIAAVVQAGQNNEKG